MTPRCSNCCGVELVGKLKNRDPRNAAHLLAAMAIINGHASTRITSETAAVMRRLDPARIKNIPVSDARRQGESLIGGHYLLEQGLLLPDNHIVTCHSCNAALQIRPPNLGIKVVLCVFCGADEIGDAPPLKPAKARQQQRDSA
jgi:hypothetical protein